MVKVIFMNDAHQQIRQLAFLGAIRMQEQGSLSKTAADGDQEGAMDSISEWIANALRGTPIGEKWEQQATEDMIGKYAPYAMSALAGGGLGTALSGEGNRAMGGMAGAVGGALLMYLLQSKEGGADGTGAGGNERPVGAGQYLVGTAGKLGMGAGGLYGGYKGLQTGVKGVDRATRPLRAMRLAESVGDPTDAAYKEIKRQYDEVEGLLNNPKQNWDIQHKQQGRLTEARTKLDQLANSRTNQLSPDEITRLRRQVAGDADYFTTLAKRRTEPGITGSLPWIGESFKNPSRGTSTGRVQVNRPVRALSKKVGRTNVGGGLKNLIKKYAKPVADYARRL